MRGAKMMLVVAWAPLLSGCMMMGGTAHTGGMAYPGGMGHADGTGWSDDAGHAAGAHTGTPRERASASNDGLTIVLFFPTPVTSAPVAIDARLSGAVVRHETDADVALRIETPGGSVDRLLMQRVHAAELGTYRALYRFPAAGRYVVTAEARTGTGADVRAVSVTTAAVVGGPAHDRHGWLRPAAVIGGLGMVAMMVLMMAGSIY